MPRLIHRPPKYRKHKASGQAIVTINGTDHYLGPYGTKASKLEYDRLISEWLAHGRVLPTGPDPTLTITEVLAMYVKWAKGYYLASNELEHIKLAIRPLKELYGRTPAAAFGPLALKTVRERMIANGLTRSGINKRIGRIKRIFRWAVENELLDPSVFHALQALRGLSRGRTKAKEAGLQRGAAGACRQDRLPTHTRRTPQPVPTRQLPKRQDSPSRSAIDRTVHAGGGAVGRSSSSARRAARFRWLVVASLKCRCTAHPA